MSHWCAVRRSSAHFIHDAPSSSAAGPVHWGPRQPVGTLPSHRTNTPRPFGWRNLEKKIKQTTCLIFFSLPSVFIPHGYWCKGYRGHVSRVRYSFRRSSPSPVLVCLLVFFSPNSRNFSFLFLTFYTTNAPQ